MNKLKRTVTTLDDVEEQFRGLYRQDGEKFTLDIEIEGTTSNKTLKEFRENNQKMKERLEAYGDKDFGGGENTPEDVTALIEKRGEYEDFQAKGENKINERVEARTKEMKTAHERETKKRDEKITDLTNRLRVVSIEAAAVEAAVPHGLRKTATPDLVSRVSSVFSLNEKGEVVALDKDGSVRRDENDEPLTVHKYVEKLAGGEAKHLFESSSGGGADPSKGGSRTGDGLNEINPWAAETFNRTAQGRIINENPEKAVRMAKKAGVELKLSNMRASGKK